MSDRRTLTPALLTSAAVALTVALVVPTAGAASATSAPTPDDSVQVLLVSIDALHPHELDELGDDGSPLAPNLRALRDGGTWWTEARSVMASETLPNHVAMGTGTYPEVNGIPGNDGRLNPGDTELADPDLGVREARTAVSTVAAIEEQCSDLRTVTVLSKEYVWRTFADEADEDFHQPSNNVPASGHALEASTMPYLLQALEAGPVDLAFVNLGDHDRAGHIDTTGALPADPDGVMDGPRVAQRAALAQVDDWIGVLVAQLQSSGQWERTVLMVVSDHSMVFTLSGDSRFNVDVGAALEQVEIDNARDAGSSFLFSDNGGAGFVYLLDPADPDGPSLLAQAYAAIAALDGVEDVLYRQPNAADPAGRVLGEVHPDWHLAGAERVGEILTLAEPRFRMGNDPDRSIPGVHGHTVTRHITALVSGGWDGIVAGQRIEPSDPDAVDVVDDTAALPEQAEQVDWAPTIGWLLGVRDPGLDAGTTPQWQGRVLEEAFQRQPAALPCSIAAGDGDASAVPGTGSGTTGDGAAEGVSDGAGSLAATGGGAAVVGLLALAGSLAVRRRRP